MRRSIIGLAVLALLFTGGTVSAQHDAVRTYVDEPIVGWHWYNEPVTPVDELAPEPTVPLLSLPPSVQMKVLQKITEDRLNNAILYPTVENFTAYMKMQNFWTSQASRFSAVASQSMLAHPELDYNLQYSHYNSTVPLQLEADRNRQVAAIRELATRYGLFFFYRGNDALDSELAKVVQRFSEEYRIALIPVSMDGARSEALPQTRPDAGQSERLGVTHLPALYLVEPGAERYQPLAYGFMTQDDLMKRFLSVATGFAPRS